MSNTAAGAAQDIHEAAQRVSYTAANASSSVTNASSSVWDRVSNWIAEHKVLVYTVAGVTVISGVGFYYVRTTGASKARDDIAAEQRQSKKERRRVKKEAEEAIRKGDVTQGRNLYNTPMSECSFRCQNPKLPR